MTKYKTIYYLKTGNEIQKRSYKILVQLNIMEYLGDYTPLLTGTIPIGIDIEGSDLDIICTVRDSQRFEDKITSEYGNMEGYRVTRNEGNIVINFIFQGMEIELYGVDKPTDKQNAYRHMLVEARLLELGEEEFRNEIVRLKKEGIKTEPPFCKALGVDGNPYENMLDEKLMIKAFKERS